MERDVCKGFYKLFFCNFNSHAHVERDVGGSAGAGAVNNFNSHAHVERDGIKNGYVVLEIISTHTLTWSVTANLCRNHVLAYISTHTLTWSVTRAIRHHSSLFRISTHTLTWSVTRIA